MTIAVGKDSIISKKITRVNGGYKLQLSLKTPIVEKICANKKEAEEIFNSLTEKTIAEL